jgi:hypothetical protein
MAVRIFKVYTFNRWAKNEGLTDADLREAVEEIEDGLVDAHLGGWLIKKRVAAAGRGKSGGYRIILAHRQGGRLVFQHGFAKNEKDNISLEEKKSLQKEASYYMALSDADMLKAVKAGLIFEVRHEQDHPKRP